MTSITQPLHDEHQGLFPHIERLRECADLVGEAPIQTVRQGVDEAYEFLAHHLLVHAQAEDQELYPVVARALGSPRATDTMRRDHVEIGKLIDELGGLRKEIAQEDSLTKRQILGLRRVLYGLYTLVKVHFVKEEEVFLPLLDEKLTPEEGRLMYTAMEAAAAAAAAR